MALPPSIPWQEMIAAVSAYKGTGNDIDAGPFTAQSRYIYSLCDVGIWTFAHAYPVSKTYTLAPCVTIPIKAPIYF